MPAQPGRSVTVQWAAAALLGVREMGINLNGEPIDVTSGEDAGWRTLLSAAQQQQVDITISGVDKDEVLKQAWFNDREDTLTVTYPSGDTISGTFVMSSYTENDAYQDAVTFEATFQSSGVVTYTAVP